MPRDCEALGLTGPDREVHEIARAFVERAIQPYALAIDRQDEMAPEVLRELRQSGLFGMNVGSAAGGLAYGPIPIGLYHEAVGQASSAVRSILTVHGMVCEAL